ncbi:uncharacterized protein IAS62_000264 [Cryptococcus decagattii]|uniref:Uncharacterized protein n=1 Tax=Cryptococcus decagattii TaxID=1859122 RepID=A0ABZ2AKC3_9TREE
MAMMYPARHHISLPYSYYTYTPVGENAGPSPIYTLLNLGMVFFMAANIMPVLSSAVDRVWHDADPILKWGFFIIISALLAQMLGLLPGVPYIHITYVHMVMAFLLFAILWNTFLPVPNSQMEETKAFPAKENLTAGQKRESSKKETKKEEAVSPWEVLRAHPSAFLPTRLNKMMPWSFPMGKAVKEGRSYGGRKGHTSTQHSQPRREEDRINQEIEKIKESNISKQAMEARQRRKLCRTKILVMIIGISSINMTLGFLLLIFYSFQIVSQELSHPITPSEELTTPRSNSNFSSSSSGSAQTTSNSIAANGKKPAALEVVKEDTVSRERVSSSKPSSVGRGEMPAASKSIQKPTGSNKVTKVDADDDGTSNTGTPNQASIRSRHETRSSRLKSIPSLGIPYPLTTTVYKHYAN